MLHDQGLPADLVMLEASVGRWSWEPQEQPKIVELLNKPTRGRGWCDRLDEANGHVTGKVLTVCAALSIARESVSTKPALQAVRDDLAALALLDEWIDDPSDERFERICRMIFGDRDEPDAAAELSHAVWWALRCATAHPDGCGESAWALEALCDSMVELGSTEEWLQTTGLLGVRSRMRTNSPNAPRPV